MLSCFLFDCLSAAYRRVAGFCVLQLGSRLCWEQQFARKISVVLLARQGKWEVVCGLNSLMPSNVICCINFQNFKESQKNTLLLSKECQISLNKLRAHRCVNSRELKYCSDCTSIISCTVFSVKIINPFYSRLYRSFLFLCDLSSVNDLYLCRDFFYNLKSVPGLTGKHPVDPEISISHI